MWLSTFIHEATHIWQRQTNRHREGVGSRGYDYTASQLASGNLKVEQHAQAVQDWFTATYGVSKNVLPADGFISDPANTVYWKDVWVDTLGRAGASSTGNITQNIRTINMRYNPVLKEIRQTRYLLTDRLR